MIYCPVCGTENDDSNDFCTNCGHDLRKYRKSPGFLTILLGILLMAAFAVLCLLLSEPLLWLLFVFFVFGSIVGLSPIVFIIALLIFPVVSIPYWIRLRRAGVKLIRSGRTKIGYAFRWFLKGPFAYRDLKMLENS